MTEEEYRDDVEMEEYDEHEGGLGQWLQDNLRIIISVIIVLLLALGIYSYSKRSQDVSVGTPSSKEVLTLAGDEKNSDVDEKKNLVSQISDAVKKTTKKTTDTAKNAANAIVIDTNKNVDVKKTVSAVSKEDVETNDVFVMTVQAGNGRTHVARRALAMSLAKNPVDGLSGAHKVYIEDYLQKAANGSDTLIVGQEIKFSKDLIKQAIERSQNLTDAQLKNLEKYAQRTPLS